MPPSTLEKLLKFPNLDGATHPTLPGHYVPGPHPVFSSNNAKHISLEHQ